VRGSRHRERWNQRARPVRLTQFTIIASDTGKLWEPSIETFANTLTVNTVGIFFTAVAFLRLLDQGTRDEKVVNQKVTTLMTIDQYIVYPSETTTANIARTQQDSENVLPSSVVPEQRMGDDRDMSGAVLFLASRAGAYCNGTVLVTDGGRLSVTPA
jgi:NAD(P)-dependent dehydrogenase (short-subunit alcohol dehydrogenase family)